MRRSTLAIPAIAPRVTARLLNEGFIEQAQYTGPDYDRNDVPLPFDESGEERTAEHDCKPIDSPREQDMPAKPDRQIQNHPHDSRRHSRESRCEGLIAVQLLNVRRSEENPEETRDEGRPGRHQRTQRARKQRRQTVGMMPRAEEPDELQNHDQRPWGGLSKTEPVKHFARTKPVIVFDCLLRYVRQNS